MINIIILIYGGILAAIWALLEVFNQDERVSYKGGIIFSTIFLALQIHITIFSPTTIFMALFFANFQIAGFINHRYDKFTPILESARFASFFFVIFFNLWIINTFPIVYYIDSTSYLNIVAISFLVGGIVLGLFIANPMVSSSNNEPATKARGSQLLIGSVISIIISFYLFLLIDYIFIVPLVSGILFFCMIICGIGLITKLSKQSNNGSEIKSWVRMLLFLILVYIFIRIFAKLNYNSYLFNVSMINWLLFSTIITISNVSILVLISYLVMSDRKDLRWKAEVSYSKDIDRSGYTSSPRRSGYATSSTIPRYFQLDTNDRKSNPEEIKESISAGFNSIFSNQSQNTGKSSDEFKTYNDNIPKITKKCPDCGHEIDEDSIYCDQCGKKLID